MRLRRVIETVKDLLVWVFLIVAVCALVWVFLTAWSTSLT